MSSPADNAGPRPSAIRCLDLGRPSHIQGSLRHAGSIALRTPPCVPVLYFRDPQGCGRPRAHVWARYACSSRMPNGENQAGPRRWAVTRTDPYGRLERQEWDRGFPDPDGNLPHREHDRPQSPPRPFLLSICTRCRARLPPLAPPRPGGLADSVSPAPPVRRAQGAGLRAPGELQVSPGGQECTRHYPSRGPGT